MIRHHTATAWCAQRRCRHHCCRSPWPQPQEQRFHHHRRSRTHRMAGTSRWQCPVGSRNRQGRYRHTPQNRRRRRPTTRRRTSVRWVTPTLVDTSCRHCTRRRTAATSGLCRHRNGRQGMHHRRPRRLAVCCCRTCRLDRLRRRQLGSTIPAHRGLSHSTRHLHTPGPHPRTGCCTDRAR